MLRMEAWLYKMFSMFSMFLCVYAFMQIQVEGNLLNELHFCGQRGLEEKHEFWRWISFWKGAFRRWQSLVFLTFWKT